MILCPEMKFKNGFTSNISRYLWWNLFHFSKLRWLVGFPFYSIYSIFKLISKKKLNLHIYLLIEFQLESKFEIIFSLAPAWLNESYLCVGSILSLCVGVLISESVKLLARFFSIIFTSLSTKVMTGVDSKALLPKNTSQASIYRGSYCVGWVTGLIQFILGSGNLQAWHQVLTIDFLTTPSRKKKFSVKK